MASSVYNGFWINWEDGRIDGATLTLPTYTGLVLVSFLTLFVQFSGACFWRVVCFILHQSRSTTETRDGLYHQQQAILRNAVTAPNALWSLSRSTFAWSRKARSPFRKSITLLLITIVHIAFFATAGLFSSRVTTTTAGQALIRSSICGFPKELANVRNTESVDLSGDDLLTFNTETLLGRLTLTKSAAYVRSCYNDDLSEGSADCSYYVQPHLVGVNSSAVGNASCPFGSDACATPAAVRYDSGHIHSNEDLGINYPDSEALSMRRVTTCAPIRSENYATDWVEDVPEAYSGFTNTSAKYYEFGKGNRTCEAAGTTTNLTTFCVTKYQKDFWQEAYTVQGSTVYHDNDTASDFTPISDFQVSDADVTLISIFSTTKYTGKVTDPLFDAQNVSDQNTAFFTPSNDLAVLGCTEQYQFCNVATGKCTELTGLYGVQHAVENGDLSLTPRQQATYNVMWKASWSMSLQWALEILSSGILLAKDWLFTLKSTTSSALPSYQWELESFNIHNLSLATFQRRVNEYASPERFEIRPGLNSLDQIVKPTEANMLEICNFQKVRSSDHYSVSVLGMGIILGVGSFLILLDWILIQQIFWFRSFTHHRLAKKADWTSTGTLQLQRQALEARGVGPWTTHDYEFPVLMEPGRHFGGLGLQTQVPLGQIYDEGSSYDGGKYSALPNQVGPDNEIHVGDDKARVGGPK